MKMKFVPTLRDVHPGSMVEVWLPLDFESFTWAMSSRERVMGMTFHGCDLDGCLTVEQIIEAFGFTKTKENLRNLQTIGQGIRLHPSLVCANVNLDNSDFTFNNRLTLLTTTGVVIDLNELALMNAQGHQPKRWTGCYYKLKII